MSVSVVIPSYDRSERLLALLAQLQQQDVEAGRCEIIVIDDGSPTPIEPQLADLFNEARIPVRCLRQGNAGPATARNFGAKAARGEYLLFVDDDMLVPPDFVRVHLETQREFGPAMVTCQFDWRIEASPASFQLWYERLVAGWVAARRCAGTPIGADVSVVPHSLVTGANLSLPRADFLSGGGFDTEYPFGCEDQDLGLRLGQSGLRALATRRTIATHVETHNTLRRVCERQRRGAFDTVRFVRRFDVERHFGVPSIARANDPVRFGADAPSVVLKKSIRHLMTRPVAAPLVFAGVRLLEAIAPQSPLLQRVYSVVISAHVQQGWREGLRKYEGVAPLADWNPAQKG